MSVSGPLTDCSFEERLDEMSPMSVGSPKGSGLRLFGAENFNSPPMKIPATPDHTRSLFGGKPKPLGVGGRENASIFEELPEDRQKFVDMKLETKREREPDPLLVIPKRPAPLRQSLGPTSIFDFSSMRATDNSPRLSMECFQDSPHRRRPNLRRSGPYGSPAGRRRIIPYPSPTGRYVTPTGQAQVNTMGTPYRAMRKGPYLARCRSSSTSVSSEQCADTTTKSIGPLAPHANATQGHLVSPVPASFAPAVSPDDRRTPRAGHGHGGFEESPSSSSAPKRDVNGWLKETFPSPPVMNFTPHSHSRRSSSSSSKESPPVETPEPLVIGAPVHDATLGNRLPPAGRRIFDDDPPKRRESFTPLLNFDDRSFAGPLFGHRGMHRVDQPNNLEDLRAPTQLFPNSARHPQCEPRRTVDEFGRSPNSTRTPSFGRCSPSPDRSRSRTPPHVFTSSASTSPPLTQFASDAQNALPEFGSPRPPAFSSLIHHPSPTLGHYPVVPPCVVEQPPYWDPYPRHLYPWDYQGTEHEGQHAHPSASVAGPAPPPQRPPATATRDSFTSVDEGAAASASDTGRLSFVTCETAATPCDAVSSPETADHRHSVSPRVLEWSEDEGSPSASQSDGRYSDSGDAPLYEGGAEDAEDDGGAPSITSSMAFDDAEDRRSSYASSAHLNVDSPVTPAFGLDNGRESTSSLAPPEDATPTNPSEAASSSDVLPPLVSPDPTEAHSTSALSEEPPLEPGKNFVAEVAESPAEPLLTEPVEDAADDTSRPMSSEPAEPLPSDAVTAESVEQSQPTPSEPVESVPTDPVAAESLPTPSESVEPELPTETPAPEDEEKAASGEKADGSQDGDSVYGSVSVDEPSPACMDRFENLAGGFLGIVSESEMSPSSGTLLVHSDDNDDDFVLDAQDAQDVDAQDVQDVDAQDVQDVDAQDVDVQDVQDVDMQSVQDVDVQSVQDVDVQSVQDGGVQDVDVPSVQDEDVQNLDVQGVDADLSYPKKVCEEACVQSEELDIVLGTPVRPVILGSFPASRKRERVVNVQEPMGELMRLEIPPYLPYRLKDLKFHWGERYGGKRKDGSRTFAILRAIDGHVDLQRVLSFPVYGVRTDENSELSLTPYVCAQGSRDLPWIPPTPSSCVLPLADAEGGKFTPRPVSMRRIFTPLARHAAALCDFQPAKKARIEADGNSSSSESAGLVLPLGLPQGGMVTPKARTLVRQNTGPPPSPVNARTLVRQNTGPPPSPARKRSTNTAQHKKPAELVADDTCGAYGFCKEYLLGGDHPNSTVLTHSLMAAVVRVMEGMCTVVYPSGALKHLRTDSTLHIPPEAEPYTVLTQRGPSRIFVVAEGE